MEAKGGTIQFLLVVLFVVFSNHARLAHSAVVLASWDFNAAALSHLQPLPLPHAANQGSGNLTANVEASTLVFVLGNGIPAGALPGVASGSCLGLLDRVANNGRYVELTFDSVGYYAVALRFAAAEGSSAGFTTYEVQTDAGAGFTTRATLAAGSGATLHLVDLSAHAEVHNQTAAVVRLVFSGATSSTTSSATRLDNILLMDDPPPSPSPTPSPSSSTSPSNSPSSTTSPTSTPSPSPTASPTASPSPTPSPSASMSPSISATTSPSPTTTPTSTASPSPSPSSSPSASTSPSTSATSSFRPTL